MIENLSDRWPVPERMESLPRQNGYVVPWFVAKVGDTYDFRVVDASKFRPALDKKCCWICGKKLGVYLAFPIGPMCAINKTISEPPSHRECAEYAVRVCPFLAQRQDDRRLSNLPEGVRESAGLPIKRQPGAVAIWITNRFKKSIYGGQYLFELGDPVEVLWFCHGRKATREEVLKSIESGYPLLLELAQQDGAEGVKALEEARDRALELIPQT